VTVSSYTLPDGTRIPVIGFGVFRVPDEQAGPAVEQALRVGFRAIDTAAYYGNEQGTGEGIRASGVPRGEIHLTTKVWHTDLGYDLTLRSVGDSLQRLDTDYLDLVLIHWPVPSRDLYVESWRALTTAREEGLVRSIGVSNFNPPHLARIIDETGVTPVVNQVELHPRLPQRHIRAFDHQHSILTQAWSALGHGQLLTHPTVTAIAEQAGFTSAQVLLAWSIHHGIMPLTKTLHPERMTHNLAAVEITLSSSSIAALDQLADSHRTGPDPETYGRPAIN
jgi:2,5-diketo-D-gluconate reductase A